MEKKNEGKMKAFQDVHYTHLLQNRVKSKLLGQEESALVKRFLWMSNKARRVDDNAKEQRWMSAALKVWPLGSGNDFRAT
jgi:hypothetical protein